MFERLPAWLKNKWVLFALSAAATLLVGLLVLLVFLRGAFAGMFAGQAEKAMEQGDYATAAAKYEASLSMKKNREEVYLGYGEALTALGEYDRALELLDQGIERFGGAEALYLGKARALVAAGRIGNAVDFLDNIGDSYINKSIQAARPGDLTYSPVQGKYSKAQKVTITQRPGETVYYTLNGTDPSLSSAVYKEPITVSTTTTLTAIAVSSDGLVSPRLRLEFEIDNANEAIRFTDAKIEQMVRATLDRPYGSIYAAQLLSVTDLYNDGIDGSIRSLKDLEYMPSLTSLRINDELLIEDYTPLAGLSELTILSASGCALSDSDLTYISGLTQLVELSLDNNHLTSLQSLSALVNLEYLSVAKNDLESTSVMTNFPKLQWLYLNDNRLISLEGLSGLTELVVLDVSNNYVSDLSPLTGCTKLNDLLLRYNTPKNIKKLSVLPALMYVDVSGCGLASLSVFNDYKALHSISATDNQIASLSTFKAQVVELLISRNPLVDISPLSTQKKMTMLELSGTQISDVSALKEVTTLSYLDITDTAVTDATCLKENPDLSFLICSTQCSTAGLPETVEIVVY